MLGLAGTRSLLSHLFCHTVGSQWIRPIATGQVTYFSLHGGRSGRLSCALSARNSAGSERCEDWPSCFLLYTNLRFLSKAAGCIWQYVLLVVL